MNYSYKSDTVSGRKLWELRRLFTRGCYYNDAKFSRIICEEVYIVGCYLGGLAFTSSEQKGFVPPPPRVDCVWFYLPTYTVDDT